MREEITCTSLGADFLHKIYNLTALIIIVFLSACDHDNNTQITDKICEDRVDRTKRACSAEELLFIKDWNWIIERITDFDIDKFEEKFLSVPPGKPKKPQVALLGEMHNHLEGILDNWGYINYLAKNEKVNILMEGSDSQSKDNNKDSNEEFFSKISELISLYVEKNLSDAGVPYHSSNWKKLKAEGFKQAFDYFFSAVKHLKQLRSLNNMNFAYWDKRGEKSYKYKNMVTRNTSLINSVTQKLATEKNIPIVVMAGFEHLPLGDYYVAAVRIPALKLGFPPKFSQFYLDAIQYRLSSSQNKIIKFYEERLGATQVIYDGLSKFEVNIIQAIPRSSLKSWKELILREG